MIFTILLTALGFLAIPLLVFSILYANKRPMGGQRRKLPLDINLNTLRIEQLSKTASKITLDFPLQYRGHTPAAAEPEGCIMDASNHLVSIGDFSSSLKKRIQESRKKHLKQM